MSVVSIGLGGRVTPEDAQGVLDLRLVRMTRGDIELFERERRSLLAMLKDD